LVSARLARALNGRSNVLDLGMSSADSQTNRPPAF